MNFTPEQIANTNKAGIEAILGIATASALAAHACATALTALGDPMRLAISV